MTDKEKITVLEDWLKDQIDLINKKKAQLKEDDYILKLMREYSLIGNTYEDVLFKIHKLNESDEVT